MRTIDEIIQEKKQQELENKTSQIQSNFYVSYPVSPEQASKQYDIAKSTNIPIGVVRAKENEILKRTELSTFNNEDWVNNFPAVANQLADIALAPAIKDDLDNLTNLEVLARSTKEKFQQSALQDQTVDTRLKRMRFEATKSESFKLSPIEESDIATFDASQPKDYNLNWFESVVPETAGAVRTMYGMARNVLPKAGVGGAIGAVVGGGLTRTPAGAMAGLRVGGGYTATAAAGYEMAKLETAGAYDELRTVVDENGKPLEKNVAAGAAIATGVINGAIELIPVKVGLDSVKKAFSRAGIKQATKNPIIREYLGNIAKGVLVEGGTEGAQELFNIIAAESAKVFSDGDFKRLGMKDASDIEGLFKFVSDSASRIGQSAAAGSAAGGGIAVVGGGAIATKRIYDQRKVNEREQEVIGSILDTAKQSKVLNRSSELFKDVTANTLGETNIYLPVDDFKTYFQDKPDKLASFYANAAIQDQIQEAVDTGGNIIIKANELSAAIKVDPELESLREFMKLTPESFTSLEAQDEFLQSVVPSYFQEENTRQERSDQDVVKQNIRQQLSNLGMPYEVAKQNIDLLTSFYDTQVKRYGAKDAQKIVDSYIGNLEANVQRFQKQPVNLNKIEDLDLMLDKARKPIKQLKAGKPLLKTLKEMGGVKLGSNLAGELNNLGITPKTYVGLFKKDGGIGDVDNIPASEFQAKFPNVLPEIEGDYISRQYLLDLLADEVGGQDISQAPNEEQRNIQNFLEGLDRAGIDITKSNEEIKKAIKEFEGQTFNQTQEIKLEQQGRYGSFYGEFNGGNIRVSDHPAGKKAQTNADGSYEGGRRSIGLENYQELKEGGVKFFVSDDFRDVIIPVKAKVDVDLENQIKIQEREIAEQKAFNSKEYQDLYKSELNNELNKIAEQRKKINKKLTYQLTDQDKQDLKQIKERENQIFESEEYKNQSEQRDKVFKELVDKELEQLTEQEKEQAKTKAKKAVKDLKKDSAVKSRAREKAVLEKFKKIEPFVKNKILELESQTYFQDQTQTEAFKKWFGDSKVVDEKGEPLVVYHGMPELNKFNEDPIFKTANEQFGSEDKNRAYYFTNSLAKAKSYTDEKRAYDYQNAQGGVVETYLSIKNPLVVNAENKVWRQFQTEINGEKLVGTKQIVDYAKKNGFDGVVVKNVKDNYNNNEKSKAGDVYVAFEPTQIKSAIGNQGTFDPENPNIYYQTTPTFYSALEKQITDLPQGKGSPEQWAGIIKNLTQKGVKQEELDWTGIEDWIKEQEGSVTKEQILDYLKANKIEVEEVVKTKPQNKKQVLDILKQTDWENNYDSPNEALEHLVNAPEILDEYNFEDNEKQIVSNYVTQARSKTKFSKYTLPGGENYRELLMTLPVKKSDISTAKIKADDVNWTVELSDGSIKTFPLGKADDKQEAFDYANSGNAAKSDGYKSSHYDEPNILAHIRFNERTDKDGARVMFVEELQSDWHQEGRKKGYKDVELLKKVEEEIKAIGVNKPFGQVSYTDLLEAKAPESLLKKYEEAYDSYMGVPNAPFKTTWNELAFKRALMWAVENGFDKVAWTTGEQQAERYDLSKQIDKISYEKTSNGNYTLLVQKDGQYLQAENFKAIPENKLEDYVGKEIAVKIIKNEGQKASELGFQTQNPKTLELEPSKMTILSGVDLKVGGEGMKAFYDKIVPSMVNKLAKKFGGKVEDSELNVAGGKPTDYADFDTYVKAKSEPVKVHSLEITPAMRESIQQQGLPLFQNEAKPQGQTQFLPNKPIITLFETADRSTLLHELGHVFLQIQADLSKLPNMPKQFQKDWAVIEKFLDIKNGKITREAHEKFARSFEAYLREGKAPSVQLRDAFRSFKAWLIRIYKDVLQLNVKINDDIRGVFDRMLATDEQIELNRDTPLFKVDTNILELLTKAERKDYLKRTEEAKEKTKEILLRKALKQKEKENSKAYKEDRAKAEAEVRDEMNKDKTFRALHFLKTGKLLGEDTQLNPVKLSSKEVKNYDGEFIKYLPKEIFGKNSASVEMIAEEFGFKNGSEMLFALANAKDFNEELKAATDAEMIRRYGDMLFDDSLEREALEASDSEAVANKIVYELDAVNRKVKSVIESKDAYKAKAKEMFATKKIPDATDVNKYYINGLKAAREAGKALGKKDYEKAVEWKKKQLLNHYLFQESSRFKKELVRANRSYKLIKRKPSKNKVLLDEEFREKALSLLQNFGLAEKPFDYKELDVNELEAWKAEKKSEEGILGLVEFPEIAEFKTKDFNQLTTEEFRTLNDSIQNLAFVGKNLRVIEIEGKKYELNALAGEIADTVREGRKQRPEILGSKTAVEKIAEGFDEYTSTLTKAKLKAELLDGKQFGKIYNTIIDPVAQGELVRNARTKEVFENYKAIYRKHFGKKGIERKRIYQSSGYQFSKESIISLTLNWGTPINRRRVRDGFKISDSEVSNLMSKLDKNELDFIQELWDFLDLFWGETSALNKKLYGFSPSKQKPEGFVVRSADGQEVEMQGGYYPIAYAENYSDISALETIGYSKALSFDKSFLKERTTQKVEKKLELTLIPAIQHISDVVSDLSIKEASFNSFKILNNRKVKKAILETEGKSTFKILDSWIKDLFGNGRNTAGTFGRILNHLRVGTVISAMGLKFGTTVMQISGYPQSIVKIGFVPMAKGLLKFLGNGNPMDINKSYKFALEKSKILKTRESGYNRDVYDTLKIMEGKGVISRNLVKMYFYPMSKMQTLVDLPTWYGAYYKGLKDFKGDDNMAVKYADKIVVQAQGSGLLQDLSAFERGTVGGLTKSNLIKLFTPFMTYFNAKYNLALESYKNTDFKKPSNVAKFTSDIILLYAIEALIGQFVLGKIPDFDDEDEDSAIAYIFKQMSDSYFAQFPIVREAYSGLKGYDTTPAGLSGIKSVTQGLTQIKTGLSEEEVDINKVIQGINQSGGILFHYPAGQIDVYLDASRKAQEGEEVSVIDYLRKPKK